MEILVEGQLDYFEEKSWKKRYFVMKYEISSALRYIEIYKDKNWQKQLPRHVVNLHPGYEVRRKEEPRKKYCFLVKTTDHTLSLASEDENVITHWMNTLEEYNLVKSFCVQPQDTPTMARIEAEFPCHLQLVHSEVRLVSAMDGTILGLWPFKCIRRYKFVGNLFSIEAGRKAPTGEGVFEFVSNECSEIYRVMDTIIRTKAGSTTMNRIASERVHNQVKHQPVKKVNSVPISPKEDLRYEYAQPITRPPPVPLPVTPELPYAKSDPTYNILSPGIESEVDGKFAKHGATSTSDSEYNTLHFANAQPIEGRSPLPRRAPKLAGSPGSYDTLKFDENTPNRDETLRVQGKDVQYDTLQFGENRDTTLVSNVQGIKNWPDENDLQHSSGSFYNTLDHSSGSVGSVGSMSSNTYDTLHAGTGNTHQSGDIYDTLDKPQPPTTLDLSSNTYDALQHDDKTPTGRDSPGTPIKPPPRRKPPSIPQQPVRPAKPKPEKPARPVRKKDIPAKEVMEDQKRPKAESISDVIQKRLANPQTPVDDGSYASVDHEYTSIDYSKVSKSDNDFSDIYTDPDQDNTKPIQTPKPVPTKPAKPYPKAIKNLFKKPPSKPKAEGNGGNFAVELKKKLDVKLKKGGHKPGPTGQTSQQTSQSGNDDIYDEIDHSHGTQYSEPDSYSDPDRFYSTPGCYYSEPDPYSEPAV